MAEINETAAHFTAEIWSDEYNRWIVMDPFFDCRFEIDGTPAGALDVHKALVAGRAGTVDVIRGKGDNATTNSNRGDKGIIDLYYHIAADMRADTYISWKDTVTDGRPNIFNRIVTKPERFDFRLDQVRILIQSTGVPGLQLCHILTNASGFVALDIAIDGGEFRRYPSPYGKNAPQGALTTVLNEKYGSVIAYPWKLHEGENGIAVRLALPNGAIGPAASMTVKYSAE